MLFKCDYRQLRVKYDKISAFASFNRELQPKNCDVLLVLGGVTPRPIFDRVQDRNFSLNIKS